MVDSRENHKIDLGVKGLKCIKIRISEKLAQICYHIWGKKRFFTEMSVIKGEK